MVQTSGTGRRGRSSRISENRNKYPMHTNENVAIGLFQRDYAKNPFWNRRKRTDQKLGELQEEMER